MNNNFFSLVNSCGPVMWFILICSIISVYIILERLLHYHKAKIDVKDFMDGLFNILRRQNIIEAATICEETPGPVAHVLRAAILRCDKDEADIRKAVDEVALDEIARLEKNLKILATVAHIAPLLGMLGTVLGMIAAFQQLESAGSFVEPGALAGSIRMALLTTAAGISVSIPAYAFYNYLLSNVKDYLLDMEKAASEMIYFLTHENLSITKVSSSNTKVDIEEK